jgi:hypothetical protein
MEIQAPHGLSRHGVQPLELASTKRRFAVLLSCCVCTGPTLNWTIGRNRDLGREGEARGGSACIEL